ncbi:MAG: 30S ribosomal protein S9 [Sphaerochaetaceae bacterium]|nr:30S ribosomal protein S9 [Spirochaetales bacterium]MDY5499793.1 30S ribosomal protein S9 [Sphaerochaetaceae bacterium]
MATKKEAKKVENLGTGVGRRKTAVARVYLREGDGKITVNGKELSAYFVNPLQAAQVRKPLEVTNNTDKFDVLINVVGGGPAGQAGACRHGLARALVVEDEANKPALRANGYLTRDSRMVERKKYGQKKARRKFQFSKR